MARWRVDIIRKRAEHLGTVEAANEREAIENARSARVAGRFIAKARVDKKPLPGRLVHFEVRALAFVHHGLAPSHSSRRTPEHTRGEDSSCKPCS